MKRDDLENEIVTQAFRAIAAAKRNVPDLPDNESFAIDVDIRLWSESWPGKGPKGRSRSRVIGHGGCSYVPREPGA